MTLFCILNKFQLKFHSSTSAVYRCRSARPHENRLSHGCALLSKLFSISIGMVDISVRITTRKSLRLLEAQSERGRREADHT